MNFSFTSSVIASFLLSAIGKLTTFSKMNTYTYIVFTVVGVQSDPTFPFGPLGPTRDGSSESTVPGGLSPIPGLGTRDGMGYTQNGNQRIFNSAQDWFDNYMLRFQEVFQNIPIQAYDLAHQNRITAARNMANNIQTNFNERANLYLNQPSPRPEIFMKYQEQRLNNLALRNFPLNWATQPCGIGNYWHQCGQFVRP